MKFDIDNVNSFVVPAPVEICWKVVADDWTAMRDNLAKLELVEPGDPDPTGLGAIRSIWRIGQPVDGPPQVTFLTNHYRPHYLFGYKVLHFEPADSVAQSSIVNLFRPVDGGTEIISHTVTELTEAARAKGFAEMFQAAAAENTANVTKSTIAACEALMKG